MSNSPDFRSATIGDVYAPPATELTAPNGALSASVLKSLRVIRVASLIVSVPLIFMGMAQLYAVIGVSLAWGSLARITGRPGVIILIVVLSLTAALLAAFMAAGLIRMQRAIRRCMTETEDTERTLAGIFTRHAGFWRTHVILFVNLFAIYIIAGL